MTEPAELARRDKRLATIDRVFGSGDMAEMIEATRSNVHAAIEFAEEREFVTRYPIMRKGKQVGERLWFHHPTWQLLGQSFGITAYTEGEPKEIKPGTWQASAVAATIEDGRVVGRAVGLTSRSEPGKEKNSDHALAANAQTRAQRNALRSTLGAVLVAAGFQVVDPEAPASREQLAKLHILERELGYDPETVRGELGIGSMVELTREQAGELIEAWEASGTGDAPQRGAATGEVKRGIDRTVTRESVSDQQSGGLEGEARPPDQGVAGGTETPSGLGEGSAETQIPPATPNQLRMCTHPEWVPVVGRPGLLKCAACGAGKKAT